MPVITLLKGDITQIEIQAIVNSANETLLGGGGVDGAIHDAGGPALTEECRTLGGCKKGEAKITHGHNLPAQYVIHTVGPVFGHENGKEVEMLQKCYTSILNVARDKGIQYIAFPAISTGGFHFPKEQACKIALEIIGEYNSRHPDAFEEIMFVCFTDLDFLIYKTILETGDFSLEDAMQKSS